MSTLPPTRAPLEASVPDVAIVSCASLFLGHSFIHLPQCMVIICIDVYLVLQTMSPFRYKTRTHLLDVISIHLVLTLIQLFHIPSDFTRAYSVIFTKICFTYILHTPFKCHRCLCRCHNTYLGDISVP